VERLGIVGLPNAGKSALFNAVTGGNAVVATHPFSTTETNVGVAEVPDRRVDVLGELSHSKKLVHATVEFVDIAALVAGALAVTTIQTGLYRVLFLCLGFMSMGAIFAVHGLTTPGILVPNLFARFAGSAVALSAYLSLAVPGVFFAASYAPGMSRLERRLPFWPAGWLVLFVAAGFVLVNFAVDLAYVLLDPRIRYD